KAKYAFLESLKLRSQVTVSDDELRQYYEQHKSEYNIPERVKAQHILFKTQEKTREEIEKIKDKARQVLERAKKGEDFGALAKQFSEDSSASNGGDLGDFGRGQMVPEFERVAFSLGVGAISDLVQTQFGIHIIKVNGKQEARDRRFEEMKEAIRPIAELGNATEFQRRMFMMNKGEIGTAIQVDRGYVVPQLVDIVPSHPASFEEAQTRVLADVKTEKAKQLAADKAKQVEELLKSGKDLAAAAKTAGAELKTSDMLTRGAAIPEFGSIAELDKEMFSLSIGKPGKIGR